MSECMEDILKHVTLLINTELMGKALCPLFFCNIKKKRLKRCAIDCEKKEGKCC